MPQSADKVLDHAPLFQQPEYKEMLENKKVKFECGHPDEMVKEIGDWTKSWEYREKNLAREALTVNPAKACQPLGAVFASAGYEKTMSFVHGSQGCVAYYRSHLSRHFKEPASAVSSSMTEDAAVFGGLNNMVDGLANTKALYDPKMIAVSTTCMAEVIGDDLNSFILQAKEKGSVEADFNVPYAHTPAFVGSHVDGYDNMQKGILQNFWEKAERTPNESINIIPGFDGFAVANNREIKRMLDEMGVEYTFLSDVSDVYDTPSDGEFRMYDGGTTLEAAAAALNAKATVSMQEYCSPKTLEYAASKGQEVAALHYPMGVQATDEFLMKISELTGKAIPETLKKERGRLVDALADSQAHLHGKTYAIYGDPDFVYAMARFVMEMGGEPVHCLATNGSKKWAAKMEELLATSPFGKQGKVWAGKDLWHMRSLMATEPVDMLIGNSYGKYLERDTGTPLIRLMFPIFDRHHHHRFPTWGYQGALTTLVKILDTVFDKLDQDTIIPGETDYSFDLTR
ncbi:nitrogenase molybdenum-iron protein subunit beta [Pseudooceanicola nanhaiensis]|uniref:nitrogenase molybdenum-iron protein subunit beta n=1 Tax=Pseudooceanicola nanhaiensis TaxID=375761 RepID=UPI001CD41C0A|nr:nitrogenase molybdenum-iron protein subunit beta [Pseudooceanicola nanhaiensis]MCA0920185.1 nitrogenase molybdenum-iron protein subunit beta [Pseudooceanicola nanhaiensis]